MPAQWYYRQGRQDFGPFSAEELKWLANTGTVIPTMLVRRNQSGWVRATRIEGLFDEFPEPVDFSTPEELEDSPESRSEPPETDACETTDPAGSASILESATNAAATVASLAGSAANAVGESVVEWLSRRRKPTSDPLNDTDSQSASKTGSAWLKLLPSSDSSNTPSADDPFQMLRKLKVQFETGQISQDEYEALKMAVLEKM